MSNDALPRLALPEYELKLRRGSERVEVWDRLRRKYVAFTPEEYVRQRFVEWLVNDLNYLPSLMNNEISLSLNGLQRRCDTLIFDRRGKPLMVVEYKAPNIEITQQVFDQIVRYNMVLQAPYIVVSNGMTHYCCHIDFTKHSYAFMPEIPDYEAISNMT